MPINILMPALSPTMEEGTLAKWNVKEGDTVSSGDVIAEIETDKATMEFEAVDEGTIGKIVIAAGTENVKVNDLIAVLLEDGESADDIGDAPAAAPAPAAAEEKPAAPATEAAPAASPAPAAPAASDGSRIFASPLARRIAKDKGLDLGQVKGSGPKGRIVKADVEKAEPGKAAAPAAAAAPAPAKAAAPAQGMSADVVAKMYADREYEEVSLDGMRKTIAARLQEAKQTIPHFYLRRDILLDDLMKFRAQLNKSLETRGIKLSVNDFIIKACALALAGRARLQRGLGRRPGAEAETLGCRGRGGHRGRAVHAGSARCGQQDPVETLDRDEGPRRPRPRPQAGTARVPGRQLRDFEPRHDGGGEFRRRHQPAPCLDPCGRCRRQETGGECRGRGRRSATVMSVTLSVDHRVIDGALGAEFLAAVKGYLDCCVPNSMRAVSILSCVTGTSSGTSNSRHW